MGRLAVGLIVAGVVLAGCSAAIVLRSRVSAIEEYAAVKVRVYRLGLTSCRVDIITATETISTAPAWCDRVPLRAVP